MKLPTASRKAIALLASRGGGSDAILSFMVRMAGAGFTFLSQVLIARWMGLTEFGVFSNAWVWVTLLGTVVQLGLASSVTRFGAAALETEDKPAARGVQLFSQLVVLGVSVAVAVMLGVLAGLDLIPLTTGQRDVLLLGCLCIPVFAQIDIGKGMARINGPAWLSYTPAFLLRPVLLVALLALLAVVGLPMSAYTAILAMLGALVLTWILQQVMIRQVLGSALKGIGARFMPRRWLSASTGIVASDVYFMVVTSVDVLLVNMLVGPEAGGLYFAAARIATLTSYVMFAVSAVSSAEMARLHASGRNRDLARLVHRFVRWSFWSTLAIGIGLAVAGHLLLGLFGAEFVAAQPVLLILLLGFIVSAAAGPAKFLLLMTGGQNGLGLALAGCAGLAIGLGLVLIPMFGAVGAAVATTVTQSCATLAMVLLARKQLGIWSLVGLGSRYADTSVPGSGRHSRVA